MRPKAVRVGFLQANLLFASKDDIFPVRAEVHDEAIFPEQIIKLLHGFLYALAIKV